MCISFYLTLKPSRYNITSKGSHYLKHDCEHWVKSLTQDLVPAQLLKCCCVIPFLGHSYKLSLHTHGDSNLPKPPGFVSFCVTTSAINYWDDLHVRRPFTVNVQQWLRQSSLNPGATGRTGKDPWACRGQEQLCGAEGRREASVRHDCTVGCFCVELPRQQNNWVQDMYRGDWRSKRSI